MSSDTFLLVDFWVLGVTYYFIIYFKQSWLRSSYFSVFLWEVGVSVCANRPGVQWFPVSTSK